MLRTAPAVDRASEATTRRPGGSTSRPTGRRAGGGRRWTVGRIAMATALPLLVVLLVAIAVPVGFYTGTDSVRTRGFVQPVQRHQTLCVRGLNLPAGTGRVQFEILTGGPTQPRLRLDLRTARGTTTSVLPPGPAPASTQMKVAFPIPKRPAGPESVPATACVTPDHIINFGGTANISGIAPTLDGRPLISRIAVWFLPPQGERRSFLSQLPDVLQRASLFRPSVVGPWTYAVLLLLVLPGAALLGVRLLARADRLAVWKLGLGVYASAFLVAGSWALVTPPFQAPDEQDHFAYVESLARNGKAASQQPVPGHHAWSESEVNALMHTRALAANEQPDGRPPWLQADERAWERSTQHRRLNPADGGGPTTSASHGPLYFAALVPAYVAAEHASIWSQLTATRLLSAALGALAALFAFLAARELWPSRPLFAVVAGLLVAFQPMFTFISGSVNNDVGVNAAAAAATFLMVRMVRRRAPLWTTLALGLVVGLLPLIKATGYELYPIAALAVVATVLLTRTRRAVLVLAVGVLAWAIVQLVWTHVAPEFGRTTFATPGGGSPVRATGLLSAPGNTLSYVWQVVLPRLSFMTDHFVQPWPFFDIYVVRGWASFGWYAIDFPRPIYFVILALMALVIVLGAVAAWRERVWVRRHWVELSLLLLTPLVVIAAVESAFSTPGIRPVLAEMGRYAFPAIAALAVLAVAATFGVGRRRAALLATALVSAEMVFLYASVLLTLRGFYT